jgi:hypothetical protein
VKAAVVKQVEFYFSDANLPTDEFLIKQVKKSAHGWGTSRLLVSLLLDLFTVSRASLYTVIYL